jgi:hypothetical protein
MQKAIDHLNHFDIPGVNFALLSQVDEKCDRRLRQG